jgi:hypothetical protein
MSVFTPDVTLDAPIPLPIDGGNPTAVLVTGSVTLVGSTDGLALDASIQTLITDLTNGTAHIIIDNFPASQAVTGTFWQATQPVSIATMPTTPVTGTFWQAVQPVSGTVAVSNFPATQPVSGTVTVNGTVTANLGTVDGLALNATLTNGTQVTSVSNFPAIQPVSGTVAVSNFPATVAVTQSTSPWVVSGTVTTSPNVNVHDGAGNTIASTGTSLNVDVTNTVPVTGTFWQALQPVSLASTTITGTVAVTQSTSPWVVSGTVTANLGTIDGVATAANQATELTDLTSIIANQTNGTQHTIVDNFPADADALAQGSTTAGQLGALEMGAVTTAAPVYVTGTTRPLSIDTAGNLRVATVPIPSLVSTVVQFTSTGANQVLLVANAARKKAILFFTSGNWNIKLGVGATATSFTYSVSSANTTIEISPWAGEIDAICTTAGKLVNVTECD